MKWKLKILSIITGMLLIGSANALNYPGFVTSYSSGTNEYMYGSYNVGTNPRAGHANSYIRVGTTGAHGISFSGFDAVNNRSFSCSIRDSDDPAIYQTALRISSSFNDGSYLYVRGDSGFPYKCTYIYISKPSYYQQ